MIPTNFFQNNLLTKASLSSLFTCISWVVYKKGGLLLYFAVI